ncbi:MAG: deoxyhypusine hydroxylase [Chaenotheca gracillima]|nr:MAG: deoxyhypusine hydroxylase [Chaenotheca gracillima]
MEESAITPATVPTQLNGNAEDAEVDSLRKILISETSPLARRFRALFSLKHYACLHPPTSQSVPAIQAIAAAFPTPSALLKHELAYCLGQTRNAAAIPFLRERLEDLEEVAICRHEAAEALGALGDEGSIELLRTLRDKEDEDQIVRETCEIAVARVEWQVSKAGKAEKLQTRHVRDDFVSIDPAPPLPQSTQQPSIPELEKTLLDTKLPLFQRYRAMFSLRDLSSPPNLPTAVPAVLALAKGLHDPSALFRHEIAFVFGQLSHPASIPSLYQTLSDKKEMDMVRHEAAEALGSLGDEEGVEEMLKQFLDDEERVVRESIVVALDMAEFERNGEVEYALIPERETLGGTSAPQIPTAS